MAMMELFFTFSAYKRPAFSFASHFHEASIIIVIPLSFVYISHMVYSLDVSLSVMFSHDTPLPLLYGYGIRIPQNVTYIVILDL